VGVEVQNKEIKGIMKSQSPTPMRVELHYEFRISYTSVLL